MGRRLRVAVVGRRFGQDIHAPAFASDPRCEVVGVVGRDGWRDVVASADVDAVSIAVPPAAQAPIAVAAAAAGKHLFCEKPLAHTLEAAEQILRAAGQAGVVHGVDFLFPEVEAWRQARQHLAAGGIGRVRHFAYTWRVETRASRFNADSWKSRPDEGGGALGNFASHVFHNIEWLLGPVVAMSPFAFPGGTRIGRGVDGQVHLAADVAGTISISTDAFSGIGHVVEIFGEDGTLRLANSGSDYVAGFSLSQAGRSMDAFRQVVPASAPDGDGRRAPVAALARRFIDAVAGGPAMEPNLSHAVRVQRLLALAEQHAGVRFPVAAPAVELG
ncbi:MAG: Gfo/Idh/MocA family oxidoreductase [Vicinamibacterales bacterium]|nr:Gfo/Idh/MocA family oxidoreductase [Vicinamibacterales bacterium]